MSSDRIRNLELRLQQIDGERKQVVEELLLLQKSAQNQPTPLVGSQASDRTPETSEDKIALFLSLFRCRKSVYPKLWENQKLGKKGYSPACQNEWVRGLCGKPPHGKVRCSDCGNQAFPELDALAVKNHLQGVHTIGTYAITESDTCVFLAADFDGDGWKADITAYQHAALSLGVHAHIERSRSGNGGHAWIFFYNPFQPVTLEDLGPLLFQRRCKSDKR
jgi:hypothetical protein